MASSLSDSIKHEADKYSHILSVENELESKRFLTKLGVLMASVYDECDRSSSKMFKENLKLLAGVVSNCYPVDEVWVRKEKDRLHHTQSDTNPSPLSETQPRLHPAPSETSHSVIRDKLSTSALSSRSSASCSRAHKHHSTSGEAETWGDLKGVSFAKEKRAKIHTPPDNPLGPGEYSPEYRATSSRSVAAFSTTSQRMKDFGNREISPGPAYNPRYSFLSK